MTTMALIKSTDVHFKNRCAYRETSMDFRHIRIIQSYPVTWYDLGWSHHTNILILHICLKR